MQDYFYTLADRLMATLQSDEILTCSFEGEESDFVRLNHNRVRQAGHVQQRSMSLDLIEGARHASGQLDLEGNLAQDLAALHALLQTLRAQRSHLPADPYLNYATEVRNSEKIHANTLPDSGEVIAEITRTAEGLDLVGLWASGTLYAGFANALGQRNWQSSATFNLDWSCYHEKDKAVKSHYAGFQWEYPRLVAKLHAVREQLEAMAKPPRTIEPGRYRAYLAPGALQEILDMMAWGGFGLKSHRTAQTPLIKMVKEGRTLDPGVSITEDNARGLAPVFTGSGFIKPDQVTFIENGAYRDCLVSPRSAKEYDARVNSGGEYPASLDMAAGRLKHDDLLAELDTGLYINNLWYCNFSDRNNCQITGMTRFACFWVENGVIQAPLNVMRFDDSVYNMLGDRLLDLTQEREFIFDSSTYEQRSTRSYLLPGALMDAFNFTL